MTQTPKQIFESHATKLGLPSDIVGNIETLYQPIGRWIDTLASTPGPVTIGVSGGQGSGKSTFCNLLACWLNVKHHRTTAVLSIDDLYLTRQERSHLGESIHPLCAIRGVPGTHDVSLGHTVLDAIERASAETPARIPRFDKTRDDRCELDAWDILHTRPDVVLFEGWCVGARPPKPWTEPTNAREAREDPQGVWARWSDQALMATYQDFFARLDALIMIKVPSMDTVRAGRWKQEKQAWSQVTNPTTQRPGLMTQTEVDDYVALFERLTTHMLDTMPHYADVLIEQDGHFGQSLTRIPTY